MVYRRSCVSVGIAVIAALMMGIAGCSTLGPLQGADLPRDAQIVGGGFRVDWIAPADGTVLLYERKSGKLVETESLSEGDSYEYDMDLSDEEVTQTFEKAFGIPVKDARLVLYFKPAPASVEAP
ncbi:MAG TPA: hypothetical protein VLI39_00710 [Sedimentisphaerales bacterium]|nr:hypothetical protein [Sedimentisphaerales bacterium]